MDKLGVFAVVFAVLVLSCGESTHSPFEPKLGEPEVEYVLDVFLGINLMPMPWPDPDERGLMAGICVSMSDSSEVPSNTEISWMKAITGQHLWLYVFTDADSSTYPPPRYCRTAYGGPYWSNNALVDVHVMIIDSVGDSLWLLAENQQVHVSY